MSMTRREHWRRAQELLAPIDERIQRADRAYRIGTNRATLTEGDRERVLLAGVHAALAAAPDFVAEEDPERGGNGR